MGALDRALCHRRARRHDYLLPTRVVVEAMKREELFGMLGEVSKFPFMSILVLTTAGQFTTRRPGKVVRVNEEGAILLTPRGALFTESLKRGRKWLPVWKGERELSDEELTVSESEIAAAIHAMH